MTFKFWPTSTFSASSSLTLPRTQRWSSGAIVISGSVGVVVVPRDDVALDHDAVGARPQDHPGLLHAVLVLGVLDLLLGQAVDQQLVLGQLHLEPALRLVVLDLDQLLAGRVFSLASGVL